VEVDWGDGDYARIATTLVPAAEVLLDAAGAKPGSTLLDVGCGTGNVALAAAARGLDATGVDPATGLIELARDRATREGADARFIVGEAASLPLPDAAFDAVVSAFGVIFAPDPSRAVAEMLRVTRPAGVLALSSWLATGAVFEAGQALREALPAGDQPPPRWDDAGWVRNILEGAGARDVSIGTAEIAFTAASPEAWLAEQVEYHPAWRAASRALAPGARLSARSEAIARLEGGNEDDGAFRATSAYMVAVARR
jgi:SAM-dependent methyltransferase